MDFTYTETQDMLRDTLARFLSGRRSRRSWAFSPPLSVKSKAALAAARLKI
jgi:hypothetical protein